MNVDPAASMRCWAIELEVGGRVFEIPALPAADWWPVFVSGDLSKIIDLVESPELDDHLLEHGAAGIGEALKDAAEEVAGRSLHVALVLAQVAKTGWPAIGGDLAVRGFRWDIAPVAAALDAIYATALKLLPDQKAVDKFLAVLDNEALTSGEKTTAQREKALDDFAAMAGPKPTSGVKSNAEPSEDGRPRTQPRSQPRHQADPSREPKPPRGRRAGSGRPASS